MSIKAFDKISGATTMVRRCECRGDACTCSTSRFNASASTSRRIPPGVNGFLAGFGIDASAMYAARQKFTVAQVDAHLAGRNITTADRMAVKNCLHLLGVLQ